MVSDQTNGRIARWTKPELVRMGKINDVAAQQNAAIQNGNSKS